MDELYGMGRRADPVVESGHVCYVAVVVFVKVDSIPAALELDLRSQAIDAISLVHLRGFFRRVCL